MSRATLISLVACVLWSALGSVSWGTDDPHLDLGVVEGGCVACHAGHGASRSPQLPAPQLEVCLSCHGSQAAADGQVSNGNLAPGAQPQSLASVLALPFTHPLTAGAYSRREEGAVTCSSCHTPHRSAIVVAAAPGQRQPSTRDPRRFEYELCQTCHGSQGATTQSLLDISRMTNPSNRSYHPIEAPAVDGSPSVRSELKGLEINCTDCHGSSYEGEPQGPHGSENRFLLSQRYTTVDGSDESPDDYALCYGCHEREAVLDSSPLTLHRLHVVGSKTSCSTCHSAHGSVDNRALIRFGEETYIAGVSESLGTGRLEFVSTSPGSGSCYLTCHGVDHSPGSYGLMGEGLRKRDGLHRITPPDNASSPRQSPLSR